MPIFQDDIDHVSPASSPSGPLGIEPATARSRRLSEESLRIELCEGPVPDSPLRPSTPKSDEEARISDRAELIQRLKRGESPTWIPGRHVNPKPFCSPSFRLLSLTSSLQLESILQHDKSHNLQEPRVSPESPSLLPPAPITPDKSKLSESVDERLRDGLSIERPRSAFHSGDFTSDGTASESGQHSDSRRSSCEERVPPAHAWFATSPPRDFPPFSYGGRARLIEHNTIDGFRPDISPLSTSLSSFAYQPPTSPLAQSETNEDVDFSLPSEFPSTRLGSARRHTLTSSHSSSFLSPSPSRSRFQSRLSSRREGALPYQAHQPRRSLTSAPSFVHHIHNHHHLLSPQTPAFLRSRRQSFGSDTSPIQHASMVGSYEESILRGRMSTTPSKPFEFLAQIGVLGKGNCKPSLRCPRHVTLPFPAVYYSYGNTSNGRSLLDDGPSPYVGQIDLENGLPNPEEESRSRRKAQSRYSDRKQQAVGEHVGFSDHGADADRESRKTSRPKRLSTSLRSPPGGSYRIPETGQIQIVVKNQNKTAVKLFLVPYDLTGMMPGTKTFIRQRSYSAGPIIDNVPNMSQADMDRPILRYLIHLHICSPSKGRFYLYKSIRIVFANRVPDGKEKLRNETTLPEPRFSPYKPVRVMNPSLSTSGGAGAALANEKALRRRSLGLFVGRDRPTFDRMDGIASPDQMRMAAPSHSLGLGNVAPVDPIPLRLPQPDAAGSDNTSDSVGIATDFDSQGCSSSQVNSRPSIKDSGSAGAWGPAQYEKLNKGDAGYGGNAFICVAVGGSLGNAPEGLLSQRLRGLDVKPHQTADSTEPAE
ncbi:hypothetical protein TARUN_10251 [Trichoderma arundinaceum]|uniref:Atos-like conserved domain-containing protein n=1 Tax=Trichoderma arundinaceum TaxID=490622 RepID=A0A395N7A2_TRIAR|nr:hypothetical protein TARUN_10251 [Trichoderma arundinaceum]